MIYIKLQKQEKDKFPPREFQQVHMERKWNRIGLSAETKIDTAFDTLGNFGEIY